MKNKFVPIKKSKGFTLIELLVVISIFAMLTIGGCQAYKAIKGSNSSNNSEFHDSPPSGAQNAESYR